MLYDCAMTIINPLLATDIQHALPAALQSKLAVEVVTETASTNSDLLAYAQTQPWHARFAEHQTAGRGRRGNPWLALPGGSLTFSLAWQTAPALAQLSGLPLVVGLAVRAALQQEGVLVQLKWPNDIWLDGRKLGGILVESEGNPQQPKVVVGIGLNLALPQAVRERITQAVTALDEWIIVPERNQLAANLLSQLVTHLERFATSGFAPFQAAFNACDALRMQSVQIVDQTAAQPVLLRQGLCRGVNERGELLVQDASGTHAILAGEASLKPAATS